MPETLTARPNLPHQELWWRGSLQNMEFPPSCRTQLFCKLQTHFYSLAFHRLCLSWKHQGASPESVWQHPPPPHIIFCRQRGGAGRRGGCVFMLLDETNSLMPGIYQVCRGESLNISVRRRWNVTRSILWSTGMKYNSVVLLLKYFHFFSEAFNVRSRKMFDFLLHCIYFDTFRHELLCRSHAASEPIQHRF